MRKRLYLVVLVGVMLSGIAGEAQALMIYYGTRGSFDSASPGLPVEGFENTTQSSAISFTGPLNSSTNNAVFAPGAILPGVTFVDNPGPDSAAMFFATPGQSSNPTNAIGSNFLTSDSLDILFTTSVRAAAFDIFQNFGGGSQSGVTQNYQVQVFGSGGLLGSVAVPVPSGAGGFIGVQSTADLITRIGITGPNAFEVIDDVAFGEQFIPEPATLSLLGLGLLALRRSQGRRSHRRRKR